MLEKIDTSTKIGIGLEILNDHPFQLRSSNAPHEYRDRRPNSLIDKDHEYRVLIAKEYRPIAADHSRGVDLDNGLTA